MKNLFLLFVSFLLLQLTTFAQTNKWFKYLNEPVLEKGDPGEWDSQGIGIGAYVLLDGDTIKMWYHGQNNNVDAIGYATSEDGITWEKYQGNPVLELGEPGSWDGIDLQMGCVLIDGETYKMYYDGHGSEGWVIGLATSPDGIHWTKDSLNNPVLPTGPSGNWDDLAVWSPHVIKDNSIYKMWFTADESPAGTARRIGYAVSNNGINWTKYPDPVIEEEGPSGFIYYTESPSVIFDGENYHMWYSRENDNLINQIDYAVSSDGIDWIKDSLNNPVLKPGTGTSWHTAIFHPNVIESNNLYRMWFVGSAASWAVGYAEDFSKLVHADSVFFKETYVIPNTDTLNILGRVINLEGHSLTAKAFILSDDGITQDSVELFDDGLHGDSTANDGIYGGYWPVTNGDEKNYTVGIKTIDLETGFTRNGLDWNIIDRFTTAGPVTLDSISISDGFGNSFNIKPFVLNRGTIRTITDAFIKLICNDPWILPITPAILSLPDIPPGATVGTISQFNAFYIDSLFPGYFNFKVEIMSDGWTFWTDSMKVYLTGVEEETTLPTEFSLEQNYPNPFNPSTKIQYSVPQFSNVLIKVFDILGSEIETLVNEEKSVGSYEVEFDASKLVSGIYFYQLRAGSFVETKKMILLR